MKFIQLITYCLALFIAITNSFGQTFSPQKELGITIGYNYGYFKDLNYSPLNYQQKGVVIAFDYTFFNKRNSDLMNIHLGFTPNKVETNTAEYFTADFYNGVIQFDYLKKLNITKNKLTTYLGGQFSSCLLYTSPSPRD